MTFPTTTFEIAFDDPFAASPTWVTRSCRSARINRGRAGQLDTFGPGTAVFVVDNRDRALEPGYTGSAHYPDVVPNRRVRFRGDGVSAFDGYVDSIRPIYIRGGNKGDAYVEIACTDVTKFLARAKLVSPYAHEVAQDAPTHWWRCGDPPGSTVMSDVGSSPTPGTWTDRATLGTSPVVLGSAVTCARLAGTDPVSGDPPGALPGSVMPTGTVWSFEMVFRRPVDIVEPIDLFHATGTPDPLVGTEPTFNVRLSAPAVGNGVYLAPAVYLADGETPWLNETYSLEAKPHLVHVAFTRNGNQWKLYIDGTLVGTRTKTTSTNPWINVKLGVVADTNYGFETEVGEIAIYDGTALSATRIAQHAAAVNAGWAGDSTGVRISRVAEMAGFPTGAWSLDGGITDNLAPVIAPLDGVKAIDHARQAEVTERGRLFVSKSGTLTFLDRTEPDTIDTIFGDSGVEVPYRELALDSGEHTIITRATVTREGGVPQTHIDAAAETRFGEAAHDVPDALYGTDAEARDAAIWIVSRFKEPVLRVSAITVDGHRSAATLAECLNRDIGDRVLVRRRPPGGGLLEQDLVIDGVRTDVDAPTRTWTTTFTLTAIDPTGYWILDESELDADTVLAF